MNEAVVSEDDIGMGRYLDEHRNWQHRRLNPWLRRTLIITFPVLFILLFIVGPGLLASTRFPWPMGLGLGLRLGIGLPTLAAGGALYLWTIILFARAGGTQVPVAPTQSVVTTGPYAVSRNPMVTGAMIMICGAAVVVGSWSFLVAGLVIPAPYLIYIKRVEEKELELRFGDEYVAYKASTPFILPRLWRKRRG